MFLALALLCRSPCACRAVLSSGLGARLRSLGTLRQTVLPPSRPEPQPPRCFGHCTPSVSLIFYVAVKGKSTNPVVGRAGGCSVVSRAHSFPPGRSVPMQWFAALLPHGAPGWLSRPSMQLSVSAQVWSSGCEFEPHVEPSVAPA